MANCVTIKTTMTMRKITTLNFCWGLRKGEVESSRKVDSFCVSHFSRNQQKKKVQNSYPFFSLFQTLNIFTVSHPFSHSRRSSFCSAHCEISPTTTANSEEFNFEIMAFNYFPIFTQPRCKYTRGLGISKAKTS